VGNVSYYDSTGQSDFSFNRPYSEKTAELIDAEVKRMIDDAYERAKGILRNNIKGHNKLAELLMEREVIFSEDLEEIFGPRPWGKKPEEQIPANNKENLSSDQDVKVASV
jgi:cell division protease FtsH